MLRYCPKCKEYTLSPKSCPKWSFRICKCFGSREFRKSSIERLPKLPENAVTLLEQEIDKMNEDLPVLKSFILPGGHPIVSYCHVSRTICRRAERLVIKLAEKYEFDEIIIRFLNRLSDYLFVLARKSGYDLGAKEIPWKPYK